MSVEADEIVSPRPSWPRRHPWITAVLAVLLGLVALVMLAALLPVNVDDTAVIAPLMEYETAVTRIDEIRATELAQGDLNPLCFTNAQTQGQRTEKVIVFFHGFTSCPEQFRELAGQFHEMGYTVYIPRLPYHGAMDQLSEALLNTTAEELAAFTTESINIAHGLGEEVIVGGLSGGGTIGAWAAQTHPDVDRAVLVAPFLGIGFIPTVLNRPVARILDDIPNIWMWWDPETKADNPLTASYSYPRYPLHALAEYLRLGFAAQQLARTIPPAASSINVITNDNDESVNNGITEQLVQTWKAHGEEYLRTYSFDRVLELPHDLITPTREDGNPGLVYPVIIDSIGEP